MENGHQKRQLPKHAYDMEYSTQTRREYEYLRDHGFNPTFIKVTEYGIKTYKYTKTPALFICVAGYYAMVRDEKEYSKLESALESGTAIEDSEVYDTLIASGAPIRKVQIYA